MAAGIHFVNKFTKIRISQKKLKLRIYLKWPEMRSKVNFGHPKWVPAAILLKLKKKQFCIDLKWPVISHK